MKIRGYETKQIDFVACKYNGILYWGKYLSEDFNLGLLRGQNGSNRTIMEIRGYKIRRMRNIFRIITIGICDTPSIKTCFGLILTLI